MPTALLIANIGNSDIGRDKKPILSSRNGQINIYEKSRELWESKDFESIELLLLDPVLHKIREMFDIEQICLFYTEQNPPHPQDTKFIAHIVKSILCSRYDFDETSINLHVISKNPADYDEMLKLYRAEVDNIPESTDRVFVSVTGGTQQQNFSAMFESVARFGEKATMIYTPRGSEGAIEYEVGYEIYKRMITQRVDILKEKKMYGVAADLAEKYGVLDSNEIKMLQAKKYRLLFDFDSAWTLFNEVKDKLPEHLEEIHSAIDELEKLKSGDMCVLIHELYENMLVKWEQGAYVDFLGRLFRFEEAVLRFVFEKETDVTTEKRRRGYADFTRYIKEDNNLLQFLTKEDIDPNRIEPNRKVLRKILEFWVKEERKTKLGPIFGFVKKINEPPKKKNQSHHNQIFGFVKKINEPDGDSLANLRNKSILGHGFEGISKDRINKLYGSDRLIVDLKKFINTFECNK